MTYFIYWIKNNCFKYAIGLTNNDCFLAPYLHIYKLIDSISMENINIHLLPFKLPS